MSDIGIPELDCAIVLQSARHTAGERRFLEDVLRKCSPYAATAQRIVVDCFPRGSDKSRPVEWISWIITINWRGNKKPLVMLAFQRSHVAQTEFRTT